MKEVFNKHKKVMIGVFVIIGLALIAGISYAYIRFAAIQNDNNKLSTLCLNLKLEEGSGINLQEAFPITDADGQRLTPYTFTITNTCKNVTEYQVNLDILVDLTQETSLSLEYIRSSLNGEESKLLSSYQTVDKTIDGATTSKMLTTGTLAKDESVTYELRLWMDEATTAEEGASKEFNSKIVVTASTALPNGPLKDYGIYESVVAEGEGLYEVTHEEANITYTSDTNAINNLKQTEYRYAGKNPNNYVTFNDEVAGWRIIGLVNTPEGQRLKLVRASSIGNYSWDSSASNINSGYGVNEWSQADLKTTLNSGAYYNRTSGTCYKGQNNATTSCNFSSNGLTDDAKKMIDTITWNTGTNGSASTSNWQTANMYNYERGNNTGKICSSGTYCNDTVARKTTWEGQIGLMYPSDYGYATSGGATTNRNVCMSTSLYSWKNYSDCYGNDWIHSGSLIRLLTPHATSHAIDSFYLSSNGSVSGYYVANGVTHTDGAPLGVLPSLYLKTNVKAVSGQGTEEDPYVLEDATYKETILNGADPVLAEGLIPVTIEEDGTVKIADITNQWYRYEEQRWANAVILNSGKSISDYENKLIPEEDIESYFVWIPRYKYKIWNTGNYPELTSVENAVQTIDVVFESKDTPASTGSNVGEYLTHPAFTAFGTNGLWVGKFETGYRGATSTATAQVNGYDTSKVIIKPNVYSWRNINVANAHKNSFNYKREYDSHMMKNTEWGAVAYLQHSAFGSRKSVRINNNEAFITGYAAKNESTTGYTGKNEAGNIYEGTSLGIDGLNTYNYLSNQKDSEGHMIADLASTNANKSGVYDMSGGAWEYVMGVMTYSNGALCVGRNSTYTSGFAGTYCENGSTTGGEALPAGKYYDRYSYNLGNTQYQRGLFGDATKEVGSFGSVVYDSQTRRIGSWYADESWFVYSTGPWFSRGGYFSSGLGAGMFTFYGATGIAGSNSFRVVLAI